VLVFGVNIHCVTEQGKGAGQGNCCGWSDHFERPTCLGNYWAINRGDTCTDPTDPPSGVPAGSTPIQYHCCPTSKCKEEHCTDQPDCKTNSADKVGVCKNDYLMIELEQGADYRRYTCCQWDNAYDAFEIVPILSFISIGISLSIASSFFIYRCFCVKQKKKLGKVGQGYKKAIEGGQDHGLKDSSTEESSEEESSSQQKSTQGKHSSEFDDDAVEIVD
jgi:hypothetical protein